MSEPFIGQIMMFGGNFPIRGWAQCDGALLPISQNTALFSILGTTYGGDGRTTFGLPELRGRFPMHHGAGPGLSSHPLGQVGGSETHQLTAAQLPPHTHEVLVPCNSEGGNTDDPDGKFPAVNQEEQYSDTHDGTMGAFQSGSIGTSQSFGLTNPFLTVNFLIALQGVFPSRN